MRKGPGRCRAQGLSTLARIDKPLIFQRGFPHLLGPREGIHSKSVIAGGFGDDEPPRPGNKESRPVGARA
jgi:hypothetical protein